MHPRVTQTLDLLNKMKHKHLKRFTRAHCLALVGMILVTVLGSTFLSVIDHDTLKPGPGFPKWLKQLSYWTNIPVKLGVLHFGFYGVELYLGDKDAFQLHVGQRFTTLWFQLLQDPRWGQHLHMQFETLLQVVDLLSAAVSADGSTSHWRREVTKTKYRQSPLSVFLAVVAFIMVFQNLITSCAYHTFVEQMIGLVMFMVKMIFDYSVHGTRAMAFVGTSLKNLPNVLAGCAAVVVAMVLFQSAHPVLISTSMFVGGTANEALNLIPEDLTLERVKVYGKDLSSRVMGGEQREAVR